MIYATKPLSTVGYNEAGFNKIFIYFKLAAKVFRDRVKGYADEIERDVHSNSYAILNPTAKFKFIHHYFVQDYLTIN